MQEGEAFGRLANTADRELCWGGSGRGAGPTFLSLRKTSSSFSATPSTPPEAITSVQVLQHPTQVDINPGH